MEVEESASISFSSIIRSNENDPTEEEEEWCPLFMDSLPSNFLSNTGLSALANLSSEEERNNNNSDVSLDKQPSMKTPHFKNKIKFDSKSRGDLKVKCVSSKRSSKSKYKFSYYNNRTSSSKTKATTTLDEAQLYLQMWKI